MHGSIAPKYSSPFRAPRARQVMTGTATVQAADGVDVMVTEQFRDRGSASGGHRPLYKLVRIKLCMTVGRCKDRV